MPSYLVAGASRGIGFALVQALVAMDSTTTVYAGVRNPSSFTYEHTKVVPVQLDIKSDTSVIAASEEVNRHSKGTLGVVIINAGIAVGTYAKSATIDELHQNIDTNLIGAFRVIKAFLPLLQAHAAAQGEPAKLIAVGTSAASYGLSAKFVDLGVPRGAYAVSKAALHFLMMDLGDELKDEGILTAVADPGLAQTDMAAERTALFPPEVVQKVMSLGLPILTAAESASKILKTIGSLTPELSGKYLDWEGDSVKVLPF